MKSGGVHPCLLTLENYYFPLARRERRAEIYQTARKVITLISDPQGSCWWIYVNLKSGGGTNTSMFFFIFYQTTYDGHILVSGVCRPSITNIFGGGGRGNITNRGECRIMSPLFIGYFLIYVCKDKGYPRFIICYNKYNLKGKLITMSVS